jgi:hypothetical protein
MVVAFFLESAMKVMTRPLATAKLGRTRNCGNYGDREITITVTVYSIDIAAPLTS